MMFIIVDLPEPDGPMIATYSPRATRKSTPCSAGTSSEPFLYVLVMRCEIDRARVLFIAERLDRIERRRAKRRIRVRTRTLRSPQRRP